MLVHVQALAAVAAVAAGSAAGLVDRWRDLGPVLWLVAAGGAALWLLLLGGFALATRCRDVDPGPSTLEPGGTEPAAVVNLLTSSWRLGHEAVPATLLDLAARRFLGIDQVGEDTLVRVPARPAPPDLADYERMVLDHVHRQAVDGVVPARALTTGPENEAKGWWRRFRRSVERDARRRGLSRPRWSPAVHTILTVATLLVACLVAVAATTLPDDPKDSDDDPVGAAIALGLLSAGGLQAVVEVLNGERDTPAGRATAGRWLGLRTMLADDPLFDGYPPAGVAIWDRLLAYGAAMGVAHGAVRALPLGTERDDEAWSSVGGRWRVVRVRYPRRIPPGYGHHPARVAAVGVFQLGLAAAAFPAATAAAEGLLDAATSTTDPTTPAGLRIGVSVGLGVVVALAAVLALRGAAMLVAGTADLVRRRRDVEGRALRVRRRGDDEHPRWYLAVDDGEPERIRAWMMTSTPGAGQGSTVRAAVTPLLAHVRDLRVMAGPAAAPTSALDGPEAEAEAAALSGVAVASLGGLVGRLLPHADQTPAAVAAGPVPEAIGPPPPLPDAGTVSTAIGRAVEVDPGARPHPLSSAGASATYAGADGTRVQLAWVGSGLLTSNRSLPRFLRGDLPGLGDEAYRAVMGGGVIARRGGHVLVAMGRLPGAGDDERDRALEAAARAGLEGGADPGDA